MNEIAIKEIETIASEINSIKEQTQKILLLNTIEIGRKLVEAKELVPHGEWGKWLDESVDYSQRTANNIMKVYEEYGQGKFALTGSEKSQAIANLTYTQAVALLGVPAAEREEFIEANDIENMSTRKLQEAIKEKKELEKKLAESKEAAEREKAEKEKLQDEYRKSGDKSEEYEEKISELKSQLEAAETAQDEEEINRLSSSLESTEQQLQDSQQRIKELEKQLKEKPIDVPAIIEKVPEEIEKELETLRQQVSSKTTGENVAKFKYLFEALVTGFDEILQTLASVEDKETGDKLQKAVKGLLNKMEEQL